MWKAIRHLFGVYTPEEREQLHQEHLAQLKREAAEAKAERLREQEQARREKIKQERERKALAAKILKAKAFVKAKGLRKVRRDGHTVYVNSDNNIVNYAILYYLMTDHARDYASDYHGYSSASHSNNDDSSSGSGFSDWGSSSSSSSDWGSSSGGDIGGSFGGGDSGGGGASGSW